MPGTAKGRETMFMRFQAQYLSGADDKWRNVAGEGAKMTLLSSRERVGAQTLLEEVSYVELSDRPDFNDRFIELLAFPG